MIDKDFPSWFEQKLIINNRNHRPFIHEREVWWCWLGINIGSEQDGKGDSFARPVVVYRKFNKRICLILPLTTSEKTNALYIPIDIGDDTKRFALIHQIRSIDTKRCFQFMGTIKKQSFRELEDTVTQITSRDWNHKKSEATPCGAASGPKPSVPI